MKENRADQFKAIGVIITILIIVSIIAYFAAQFIVENPEVSMKAVLTILLTIVFFSIVSGWIMKE